VSANSVIYRGMTRAELDAAYNNSEAVADSPQYLMRWREASERVRARPDAQLDIVYGERPRARLDYFPSGTLAPALFLFIHGGYWQRNEKETFAFVAEGPLHHGIDVAVVGYTLAPDVSLTEIVAEIHQALSYLAAHADDFGFDDERLFVGGWSAGGHLTAAAAAHPACAGGLPISGIFDLEPIALNYLNDKLRLSPAEIAALSPLRHLSNCHKPLRLAVGGGELPELKRQSEVFARAASARELPVQLTMLDGYHHFSILDELARPDGVLTRELLALIGRV
jgi:arylformamidase